MKKQLILGALALSIAGTTQPQGTKNSLTFSEIATGLAISGACYVTHRIADFLYKEQIDYMECRFEKIKRLENTAKENLTEEWDLRAKQIITDHPTRIKLKTAFDYLEKYCYYAISRGCVAAYFIGAGAYLQKHYPAIFQSIAQ